MITSVTLKADHLEKLIKEFPDRAKKAIELSLIQAADLVRNEAKQNAPYLTGNLRRSIASKISGQIAVIGTDVIYARIQELGGVILPKTKKYLRFMSKGRGWVTTKRVIIKPFAGKGYLTPALKENAGKILKIFADNVHKQLTK